MTGDILIFSGRSHPELAKEIAAQLKLGLGKLEVTKFANGETYTVLDETVRGRDVFIVQSTQDSANEHIMELLIIIDAMKRSSAGKIHAVVPWYGYSRQDRQAKSREPITAKLIANMLTAAGADHVVTVDLHSGQIQGFFDIPVDNLYAMPTFITHLEQKKLKNLSVVSPDIGGMKKAARFSEALGCELAVVYKRRPKHNQAEARMLIGDVMGKDVLLVDDLIDTGGTIVEAVNLCKEQGAKRIFVCATHAVFSDPCVERLSKLPVEEVIVTDTIPIPQEKRFPTLVVLSISKLIAEAILRIHEEKALSPLFDGKR